MLALALVPILNLAGIPFGPFVGAYYGMAATRVPPAAGIASSAVRAAVFGGALGLVMLVVLVAVAVGLTVSLDLGARFTWLVWLAVVVFTMYTATMAALGAMYSQMRAAARQAEAEGAGGLSPAS